MEWTAGDSQLHEQWRPEQLLEEQLLNLVYSSI
uniref:Uncharacterized protein n=1 Tax=Arundo donax TaxID=35708 RepID=A0A0A9GUJ3_ARUDO